MKTENFVCKIGTVVRETEKAVMVNWGIETMHKDFEVGVWFPKSQLKDGKCQPWLFSAKRKELSEKFRYICDITVH